MPTDPVECTLLSHTWTKPSHAYGPSGLTHGKTGSGTTVTVLATPPLQKGHGGTPKNTYHHPPFELLPPQPKYSRGKLAAAP